MYRKVFTPTSGNIMIPIPPNWYGQNVEVIAFPVLDVPETALQKRVSKSRKRREEMNKRYSMDLSGFKFNREEANNYE
jgi:hypothetical protein